MIDVQPSLNVSIYGALEQQPATYAVRRTEVKSQFLSAGRTEFDYNCFSSTIPRRITVALLAHSAFDGALKHFPFNFKPFGLRSISVHAGGYIYPQIPYNLDFDKGHFTRAYVDMFEALGLANSSSSMDISMSKFNSGWTFFVIPLTSTLDDSSAGLSFSVRVQPPSGCNLISPYRLVVLKWSSWAISTKWFSSTTIDESFRIQHLVNQHTIDNK